MHAGTTWMQELVDQIQNDGDMEKCQRAPIYKRIPFLELSFPPPPPLGVEVIEGMASPRVIKTHLHADLLPQSFWKQKCKMIYVARNIKDVIVSNYHFHRMSLFLPEPGTWEQFLQKSMAGEVLWGSWFDHMKKWWSRREKADILYIFYEDMKEDLARATGRVASFLGRKLSPEKIATVVRNTTFETMRDNPMTNYSTLKEVIWRMDTSQFMRKGHVGDWKHHFTAAQNEVLDQLITEQLKDTSLTFHYELGG
uniref:sulfotransferase 1C2-like isoform X1 n=2 Tax=Myxine glutinosa TaxID=7769 RepID=UPI00358E3FB3